jgi:hypothetical protein
VCGAATDLALRCMAPAEVKRVAGPGIAVSTVGVAIALCCYHRCSWSAYVNQPFVSQHGLDAQGVPSSLSPPLPPSLPLHHYLYPCTCKLPSHVMAALCRLRAVGQDRLLVSRRGHGRGLRRQSKVHTFAGLAMCVWVFAMLLMHNMAQT